MDLEWGRGEVFIIKEDIYTYGDILAYLSLWGYSAKKKSSEAGQICWLQWNVLWIFFFNFILFLNFTILYSFCQISKRIHHRYDLIRCDEANRLGDNCHEGRSSDFQFPRSRRHGTQGHMGKHLGQSRGREGKGQHGHKPVVWLLWERRGRAA